MPIALPANINPGNTTTTPNPNPTPLTSTGGIPGFPSGGSPSDMLKFLSGYSLNQSNQVDPGITNTLNTLYGNVDKGLSPEAMTAMMRESTSGLQDRYNNAAMGLRTQLLQRGMYGGQLPANSGQMFSAFGPLQEGLLQAQSKAGTDAILANNQALLANRQLGLQAVGAGLNLKQLQQSGVSQAIQAAYARGEIEPTTMKNIILASLLGAGTKALTTPGVLGKLGGLLGIGGGPSSPLSAAESSFLAGGEDVSDLSGAISAMGGAGTAAGSALATGAGVAGDAAAISGVGEGAAFAGAAPGAAAAGTPGAVAPAGALSGVTGTIGHALATVGHVLMSNPATIAVGAAIAGALIWKHSQVHPTADKFVQTYQNPFGDNLGKVVNGFDQSYATGQMTVQQAQLARDQTADLIKTFDKQIDDWIAAGGKEKTVALQARRTMTEDFGPNWSLVLGKMDAEISALKQAQGVA